MALTKQQKVANNLRKRLFKRGGKGKMSPFLLQAAIRQSRGTAVRKRKVKSF